MRSKITAYFEHRGTIKLATDAVQAFIAAPTEANRLALVKASKELEGYFIPMPRALTSALRPHVCAPLSRYRLGFGILHSIARSYLKVEAPAKEAA